MSNVSKYSDPFSYINFIMSSCWIKIFYLLKLFFLTLCKESLTDLLSMSIIVAVKGMLLSAKYFERARPIAPLPHPSYKKLKILTSFFIFLTFSKNLWSSRSMSIICSVSNLGIRMGGLYQLIYYLVDLFTSYLNKLFLTSLL